MDRALEYTVLGALLHDIGKVLHRGEAILRGYRESHKEAGYRFLRDLSLPLLAEFAKYHHEEDLRELREEDFRAFREVGEEGVGDILRNLLWIVCEADTLSARERGEEERDFRPSNPLISVFSEVRGIKSEEVGANESVAFPLNEFGMHLLFPKQDYSVSGEEYEKIEERFKREFKQLVDEKMLHPDKVLMLLERYTSFVPSFTTKDNDISLFDHLKMTAAIASCLYLYHEDEIFTVNLINKIKNRNEMKFLLIGGDISGIQRFIYTITSKYALKYLRSRSFYLEILVEDIVEEIIERLNLTRCNILYAGGGHFYIIAPNTERVKEEIRKVREEANEWLLQKFGGDLFLALDYVAFNGDALKNFEMNGKSLWNLINKRLGTLKRRKFADILAKEPEKVLLERGYEHNKKECDVCKRAVRKVLNVRKGEEIVEVCEVCEHLWHLGDKLPKIEGFLRTKERGRMREVPEAFLEEIEMPFSHFIFIQGLKLPEIRKRLMEILPEGSIFIKNSLDIHEEFRRFKVIPLFIADYAVKGVGEERGVEEKISDLDEIARRSVGAAKVGVLRMDVDDLGKIFSRGLQENKRTISRIATLSRLLNYFFKVAVNLVASGAVEGDEAEELAEVVRDCPRLRDKRENIVVVYSGGDDLFVVGAWSDVFQFAFELQKCFSAFTRNPHITLSAGFAVFDAKFPIYKSAEIAKERLECAKNEGKNRISLAELPKWSKIGVGACEWEEFMRVWNEYVAVLYEKDEEGQVKLSVRRAFIWKILSACRAYAREPKRVNWLIDLYYYFGRMEKHIGERVLKRFRRLLSLKVCEEPQEIYRLWQPLQVLDMAVRR